MDRQNGGGVFGATRSSPDFLTRIVMLVVATHKLIQPVPHVRVKYGFQAAKVTSVGFEPTPMKTTVVLEELLESVLRLSCESTTINSYRP